MLENKFMLLLKPNSIPAVLPNGAGSVFLVASGVCMFTSKYVIDVHVE